MALIEAPLAEGWPGRTLRGEGELPGAAEGPVPGEGPLGGDRWFLVWNRDGLGECCCWRGTVRADGVAGAGSCQRPGKHPWVTRVDGELYGFVHGAADALSWEDVADRYGPAGGARQLAVVLDDLLVVDLDGERAVRDFARMSFTVPRERVLGVSTTPRGFHVWLDVPGWNQKALNLWMAQWLSGQGGWDPTDGRRAGRRGFLVDVRTGANRYVVWPGGDPVRRWLSRREFGRVLQQQLVGMPAWRMADGSAGSARAPWAVDTADPWLAGWIGEHRGGSEIDVSGWQFDGSDTEMEAAWAEMERWLARLESMPEGSGRNNRLNQIAYYSGAKAVMAGHSLETVRARLCQVGEEVGTHGVAATVASGLSSGLATLKKQQG
jgi:hypothetical protein